MSKLQAVPGVLKLTPYVQGQSKIDGITNPIKLSSNESSHGPSSAAKQAFLSEVSDLNRYPDGSQYNLRKAIGDVFDMEPDRIICGNGSDEMIQLMVRAYVKQGDEALLSENGFIMTNIHCTAQGAELIITPEKDYHIDVDAMLARVTDKTKFCSIANPNNPTGTFISGAELRRLHAGLPEDCLFLIDGAYSEYVWDESYEDGSALVNEFDNVVMTRTFSKIYGLPSLRIGWAYCPPEVVGVVGRIRTPFNTNAAALAAAEVAVRDVEYTAKIKQHNKDSLALINRELTKLGIEVIPSQTNFYLMKFPENSGKSGNEAAAFLRAKGIIPRPAGGSDQYLRISVGLDNENQAVLDALSEYMGC